MPYFDDDGNELNPNLIPKPALCVGCRNDDDPSQHIVCDLTRLDQQDEPEFICFTYEPKSGFSVSEDLGDDLKFGQA